MKKTGVLIIGHGSSSSYWVRLVDDAVSKADVPVPVTTCFLEMVEGRLIKDGIQTLERQGVDRIIAVPLFVSSGSTHIDEIGYMLGVKKCHHLSEELEQIETNAEIIFASAMDDHPLIIEILLERAKELSTDPMTEVVMLVGHGADEGENHTKWEEVLQKLSLSIQMRGGFKEVTYGTIHPDNLEARARQITAKHRMIVVPLFLSEGYFTKTIIPTRLQGFDYIYSGKTYLPHPLITHWIEDVIKAELAGNKIGIGSAQT